MDRIPVLFDTDIGSDIDDAVALAYLLKEPRCELLGVTTVSGEPVERARLADAVCRAAERSDIPVHAGCGEPLLVPQRQREARQKAVLPRWAHRREFPAGTAVDFLRQQIHARPGEVTLLAVGPLTNVGLLFALDPVGPSLLKRLALMGGVYTTRCAGAARVEWNASLDPHAAARVFAAPVPELVAYGLDVTMQCSMPAADCRRRLRGGALDVVADMAEVWFEHAEKITFHDPLAAVGIFEPEVCEYERGTVEVELLSPRVSGMTHWTPAADGPHRIAVEVDADRFFQRYFAVVGA
jgi:purine nucleosidase